MDEILERRRAVERYWQGESATAICASLRRSRPWLYKWVARAETRTAAWAQERSRRPDECPGQTDRAVEEAVVTVRGILAQRGGFSGAQAIRWELEDLAVAPLPSLRTIGRILQRHALIRRRSGPYISKGKPYPALVADRPGQVQQTDFVGPCFLSGPVRFHSLHSVDVAVGRCAIEPMLTRAGQATVDGVWASWTRLGIPAHQQVDNDSVFYGSRAHPRGMGSLIRLCLAHDVEPWFIPPAEPWRNGVVEWFNGCWEQHGPLARALRDFPMVRTESRRFEERHNATYRYSKLGGKTPNAALAASGVPLRFPPPGAAPRHPLPKPTAGRYHLVRLVRSDGVLDVFGERFGVPPEAVHSYVRATIDVERQRLCLYDGAQQIDEHPYRVR